MTRRDRDRVAFRSMVQDKIMASIKRAEDLGRDKPYDVALSVLVGLDEVCDIQAKPSKITIRQEADRHINPEVREYVRQYINEAVSEYRPGVLMCHGGCGEEIPVDEAVVEMYDHEGGWNVGDSMPRQWISVKAPECGYQTSLTKYSVFNKEAL